ncbi:MAG: UDP-N-acetylmuramoyl-tripeptide--D-alanyl-D-alanine ligase [Bdellovibrionales bacterium]|nr:UDP-N-acetylmuramoyl-tripeptide--D-alanyl-D-alanine ligase [Bdellovibrionales bacterium]
MKSSFLIESLTCKQVLKAGDSSFQGVGIDSRKDLKAHVFFAIKGKRFEGHDFLKEALDKGAKAFVVSDLEKSRFLLKSPDVTVLLVQDTLKALTDLARAWREKQQFYVIAITGSNGKTTTCSFTKTILSDFSPFSSPKSYNNSIGVSLSLLNVKKKSAVLIQEIGSNQEGEISFLTGLSKPNISVVTTVGASHLKGLKSVEGVAQEKQEIYLKSPGASWIFNRDNPWTKNMWKKLSQNFFNKTEKIPQKIFSFSSYENSAELQLNFVRQGKRKSLIRGRVGDYESEAEVLFSGQENLENLMCSGAIGLAMGLKPESLWKKFSKCQIPEGRQKYFLLKEQKISLYFDAYNANPLSMNFFLKHCEKACLGNNRILILGDMRELGEESENYHKNLAYNETLLSSKVIFFIGENSSLIEKELRKQSYKGFFKAFKTYSLDCVSFLKKTWKQGDFVGIKASRSLALERLVFDLSGQKVFK